MSDEENKSKVISIATRRVVEQEELPKEEESKVDAECVQVVAEFKEQVEEGKYQGVFVVGWDAESKCFFSQMLLPKDDHPDLSAAKLLAYLELTKLDLLGIMREATYTELEVPND